VSDAVRLPAYNLHMAQTPHRLPTDTDNGLLLIISGPSGAGKTTITRGVERSIADSVFSVSCTTRAKTPADTEGVDYHFIDDATFEAMKSRGEFFETAGVYGKKYGTPKAPVLEHLRRGRLVILEIDVQGAVQIKQHVPEAFSIFILPPTEEELWRRLRDRKRESEEQIKRRFEAAKAEIESAKASGVYNVFIVNDSLEAAIKRACDLVAGERARRAGR
jgi:guanylate kinase